MTDRLKGVVVTFEHDIREDDAEPILEAIRLLRGVASVKPVTATYEDDMIAMRVRLDLRKKLWKVLDEP